MLRECLRVLEPGGLLILETPNPEQLIVGGCNFYTDPTHHHPIPKQTLCFLLEACGFDAIEIVEQPHDAPPAVADALPDFVRAHFYAAPDYGVVCRKPSQDDSPLEQCATGQ